MMRRLRALFVEDSEDDAELVLRELKRANFEVIWRRVDTAKDMQRALDEDEWDIVLSDFSMPTFSATAALALLQRTGLDLPFIIMSGTIGEESAVEALKAGAHDFLVKGRLARLLPVVNRELREAQERRERRRAEAALRDSEMKYRRIVETTHEGIWAIDGNARTTFVNRRMAEMLAASAEVLVGTSLLDFLDAEWQALMLDSLKRLRNDEGERNEFKFRRADGSEFWASMSTNRISDDNGRYLGALAMVTDVTEQRNLRTQLMVSDRMASVGTLAAGVGHEINNPLSAVLANLELAVQQTESIKVDSVELPKIKELREMVVDALDAAERVRRIVRDLRIFARSEEERRGPVDVHSVLKSSLRLAWNEIRHRARLIEDFATVPPVEANESRLGQVVLNLVINAVHAIDEGNADRNEIRVATFQNSEGAIVIEVCDTGSGIAPDVRAKLFTPFFTTKPRGMGTGLGLAICHRIVTDLGGHIEVDSEVGRGSTFRIVLPAALETSAAEVESEPIPEEAVRRGQVLVVDDEAIVAGVIRRTLAREHDVVVAGRAEDALARIHGGERFDVILCDLMMPQMTGMELYAALTKQVPDQANKVVFLTGGAFTMRAREFLDSVPSRCIEKPFTPAGLRAAVNEQLRRS